MNMESLGIHGVSETLFIPLAGRAKASHKKVRGFVDERAEKLVSLLQVPARRYLDFPGIVEIVAERSLVFDRLVSEHIARSATPANPGKIVVVSLGAGLCTRFERIKSRPEIAEICKSNSLLYVEVDLPAVMAARERFIPRDASVWRFAGSFLSPEFWQKLAAQAGIEPGTAGTSTGARLLIVTEGLLMYFEENQILQMLRHCWDAGFHEAELAIDVVHPWVVSHAHRLGPIGRTGSRLRWGLRDLENWKINGSPFRLELVSKYSLTQRSPGFVGWAGRGFARLLGGEDFYQVGSWAAKGSLDNQ